MTIHIIQFLSGYSVDLLGGVTTAILIYFFQQMRYWYYLKRRFHNRQFNIFYKYSASQVERTVRCVVEKNRIKYKGEDKNKNKFEGEFIMNPINLKIGEGYHVHDFDDHQGFNFPKIIIKDDNTFLVETSYAASDGNETKKASTLSQAFIWRKILPPVGE